MNFLAHALLSGDQKKVLVGNLVGDFIKGRQALSQYDRDIIRGVELHRAIDEYTDLHPVVRQSKERLRPGYRHYAGVIVDVFYDHFLAVDWHLHHNHTLELFAANVYSTLQEATHELPDSFNRMLPYMIRGNWLLSYRSISGINRALTGMASRTPYRSGMEHASADLARDFTKYQHEFRTFFPQLKRHVIEWLENHPSSPMCSP